MEANLSLRFVAHGSEAFVANLQRRLAEARHMLIEVLGPSNMYVYRSKLLSAQIFCKRGDRQTLSFVEQARIALKEAFNSELLENHPIFSELNKVTCDLLM